MQEFSGIRISPLDAAVITVGSIHGGQAPNVVNEETTLQLTVRTLKPEVRDLVLQRMRDVVDLQARSFGASATVEITNSCPSLVNGCEATQFAVRVAQEFAGAEKVVTAMPVMMGSEDFAFMLNAQPNGCYFFLYGFRLNLVVSDSIRADASRKKYGFRDMDAQAALSRLCRN